MHPMPSWVTMRSRHWPHLALANLHTQHTRSAGWAVPSGLRWAPTTRVPQSRCTVHVDVCVVVVLRLGLCCPPAWPPPCLLPEPRNPIHPPQQPEEAQKDESQTCTPSTHPLEAPHILESQTQAPEKGPGKRTAKLYFGASSLWLTGTCLPFQNRDLTLFKS